MAKKRTLTGYSVAKKIEILDALDKKELTRKEILAKYGVPNSTLSTFIKYRADIEKASTNPNWQSNRKRRRKTSREDMEGKLYEWFKQARAINLAVSGPILAEKAVALCEELGVLDFVPSNGWLQRFRERRGIDKFRSKKIITSFVNGVQTLPVPTPAETVTVALAPPPSSTAVPPPCPSPPPVYGVPNTFNNAHSQPYPLYGTVVSTRPPGRHKAVLKPETKALQKSVGLQCNLCCGANLLTVLTPLDPSPSVPGSEGAEEAIKEEFPYQNDIADVDEDTNDSAYHPTAEREDAMDEEDQDHSFTIEPSVESEKETDAEVAESLPSEVKIEIDVAEDPSLCWGMMAEQHTHNRQVTRPPKRAASRGVKEVTRALAGRRTPRHTMPHHTTPHHPTPHHPTPHQAVPDTHPAAATTADLATVMAEVRNLQQQVLQLAALASPQQPPPKVVAGPALSVHPHGHVRVVSPVFSATQLLAHNLSGLRIRLVDPPAPKAAPKSNAERCQIFRQSVKSDPLKFQIYQQKYLERNRNNRKRVLTEEERLYREEQNRVRQQRLRDARKAEACAAKAHCTPPKVPPKAPLKTRSHELQEEKTKAARREKWVSAKQKEREGWSAQRRRRNREMSLANYYKNKAKRNADTVQAPLPESIGDLQQSTPNTALPPSQTPSRAGEIKAVSRAKNAVLNLEPGLFACAYFSITKSAKKSPRKKEVVEKVHGDSPSAKQIKQRMTEELAKLKSKRSKASLSKRKLLLDTYNGNTSSNKPCLYSKKKSVKACAIEAYLEDIAVDLPGKRSVDKKTLTQKKILPKRVKRIHRDFCKQHPQLKVSRATFYRHIPKHIFTTMKQQHQQCLCEVCVAIDQKLDVLNQHFVNGRDCLSEASLCSPVTLDCINRNCEACGVTLVREKMFSDLKDKLPSQSANTTGIVVRWMAWEMVQRGKIKRRDQVEKEGTLVELIELLLQELQTFSKHLFVFRWQYAQYKMVKATIPKRPRLGLAVMDFAENYQCKHQDAVQSAYYGYLQVTVHPTVTFYHCDTPNCQEVMTEYQVFLSDDITHDASLAKTIMDMAIQHMKTRVNDLEEVVVFSDGCAAQYKSRLLMLHLANASGPVQVTRAYFGSRHGKSACDATGGVIKRAVEEDVLAREVIIQDAPMMYKHCTEHYTLPTVEPAQGECCKKHVRRTFFLVEPDEVDRSMASSLVQTIPGTRSFHSVQGIGNDGIKTRKLSCFCTACFDQDEANCVNRQFVDKWDIVKIKRVNTPSSYTHQDCFDPSSRCPEAEPAFSPFPHSGSSNVQKSEVPPTLSEELSQSLPAAPASSYSRLQQNVFFRKFYRGIQTCKTYEQLQELVQGTDIGDYPPPPCTPKDIVSVKGTVDKVSLDMKPPTAGNLFPIKIVGDGNCLARCFSVLVYGTESHHQEMRCRVVHELVTNKDANISGEGMGEDPEKTVKSLVILQEDTDLIHHSFETVTPDQVEEAFEKETMAVRRKSVSMGLWQIVAGATILNCTIISIYPNKGYPMYQELYNRTVSSLSACQNEATVHIMSTTNRNREMADEHWVANHYVILLPMSCKPINVSVEPFRVYNTFTVTEVAVGEYYRVTWNGSDYIGRVDEITGNTIFINIMKEDKELYVFPSKQDSSWEHVAILKTRVHVDLAPECSTHRNLCYRLV